MRRLFSLLALLTLMIILQGCEVQPNLKTIELEVDFETKTITSLMDGFSATFQQNDQYHLVIQLEGNLTFNRDFKLYLNETWIHPSRYTLEENTLHFSFYQLEDPKVDGKVSQVQLAIDFENQSFLNQYDYFQIILEEGDHYLLKILLNEGEVFADEVTLEINDWLVPVTKYTQLENEIQLLFESFDEINPEALAKVDIQFHLNGGMLTATDFETIEPDYVLTIEARNSAHGQQVTLITTKDLVLRYYHKLFLKFNDVYGAYQVVAVDPSLKPTTDFKHIDYDYIIAVPQYYQNESVLQKITTFTTETERLQFVVFNQELSTYTSGPLLAQLYPEDLIGVAFTKQFTEEASLPVPVRDEYRFSGWFDGVELYETYLGYQVKDAPSGLVLEAVWEGYTLQELYQQLDGLIPDETHQNVNLPTTFSHYQIEWTSSREDIINPSGHFNRPFTTASVRLTAHITGPETDLTKTYDVIALPYKSLEKPIASSYIYRGYDLVDDNFFETLDIINTAFVLADANGNLYDPGNYLYSVNTYIMPKAKQYGNWVLMSVGPGTSWSSIVATPGRIETFANDIVHFINTYGFDGVDIDWETPTTGEATRYTKLMEAVYEKVKANNPKHLVTTAITGGIWQPQKYDLTNSIAYLDYINIMTYSMMSNSGVYQNPLYRQLTNHSVFGAGRTLNTASIDESVKDFKNTYGIAYDKLIVGLAFYGVKQIRTYIPETDSYTAWVFSGTSPGYHEIVNQYLSNPNYTEVYDRGAGVPYLIKNDGTVFISYDNPRSIIEKGNYVIDNGLAGMMYWEQGKDNSGILLGALRTVLEK